MSQKMSQVFKASLHTSQVYKLIYVFAIISRNVIYTGFFQVKCAFTDCPMLDSFFVWNHIHIHTFDEILVNWADSIRTNRS